MHPGSLPRVRSALVVGVVALLGLSGCGGPRGSGGADAGGELTAWMGSACAAVGSVAEVADQRSQLDWARVSDPDTAAALVAHLRLVAGEVGTAQQTLESLGAPPVDDGAELLSELRLEFTDRRDALANAVDFIEGAASRIDPLAPAQIARAAQSAYTAAPKPARELERRRELRDAFASAAACAAL